MELRTMKGLQGICRSVETVLYLDCGGYKNICIYQNLQNCKLIYLPYVSYILKMGNNNYTRGRIAL